MSSLKREMTISIKSGEKSNPEIERKTKYPLLKAKRRNSLPARKVSKAHFYIGYAHSSTFSLNADKTSKDCNYFSSTVE